MAPNTGVLTMLAEARIDVAFMPVDEERRKRLDFGPADAAGESTYMVTAAPWASKRRRRRWPGVRVVGVANTTTIRAAGRTLRVLSRSRDFDPRLRSRLLRDGKADAFALGRLAAADFVAMFPGLHIVDGGFQQTVIAIAVPKGGSRSAGLCDEIHGGGGRSLAWFAARWIAPE